MLEREDLRQVRAVIKDVLREGQLDKLPDLFGREHHKHRGTHDLTFKQLVDAPDYIDNRQFITIVNEDEDGIAFIDLIGVDHQVVVTKNPHDITLGLHHQVHVYSDEEAPRVRISNLSDTLELDPVLQFGLGADDTVKFTMGADDSDSDAWLLCSGGYLSKTSATELYNLPRTYGTSLVITEVSPNQRIQKLLRSDLSYAAKIGSLGSGDDQFSTPQGICSDGTFLYICDLSNDRIVKRRVDDLFFVAKSSGVAGTLYSAPRNCCTDGTYLYFGAYASGEYRIYKILCSDLSYVDHISATDDLNNAVMHMATDGTYLYLEANGGNAYRMFKVACATMTRVLRVQPDGEDGYNDNFLMMSAFLKDGVFYLLGSYSTTTRIFKYDASTLIFISYSANLQGTGDGQLTSASGMDTDGTYIYTTEAAGVGNINRVQKLLLSDYSFVAKIGVYGNGNGEFSSPFSIVCVSSFSQGEYVPANYPILVAALDGSYVDAYPLLRARDGFQLMEDGTVGATDYVGLYAPAAITESYSLTFPGTGPAAVGHFAVSAAGVISFGQNVGTTGSPTFVRIVSLSQAIGTAPITVTSTTVCGNLNAGMVDGYHHDQSLLTTVGPSFDHLHLTIAIGTAPLVVTSTTKVDNLNADLLDGLHYTSFSPIGHDHSGVYSPIGHTHALDDLSDVNAGAPNDNDVLSWDVATSKWIAVAPSGGAGTFITLTDCPASYATHGGKFVKVNAGENALEFVASSVAGHDILSASHGDALASAVSRGSIIYGNSTPKWAELPVGNAGDVLTADGTDVAWAAPSGGSAHVLLSATHTDTLADTVIRGDVLYGNATPKWARLAKGTSGYLLKMGADDPAWAAQNTLKLDDFGAPDDNTDLDVSASVHGLAPKRDGSTLSFLSGAGTWIKPGMYELLYENFDGLSTAAINGQGSYTYFAAWAVTLVGATTINVTVLSGADKMLTITGDTVTEGSSYAYLLTNASWHIGLAHGTRFHFKMRTSSVVGTKGWTLGSDSDLDECQVYFSSTNIVFWNGSATTTLMAFSLNTWYEIDVIMVGAIAAIVFIDGVQQGAPKACGANTENWNRTGVYINMAGTAAAGNLDFTDFSISTSWFMGRVD